MKNRKNLLSIFVIIYLIANILIGFAGTKSGIVIPFLVISLGIYIYVHGTVRYGPKNILLLIGIGMVVSLFYEALSISTGFPYSGYHYTEILGPQLLGFPILVMVGYGVITYTFWIVAEAISGNFNNKLKGLNIVLIPLIASVLFTSWDYVFDPIMSTIGKAYIWDNPGAYFGVPFANYMGWHLATYTIFQIFAFIISRQKEREVPPISKKKVYWYQPIVVYAAIFIQLPILMMFQTNEVITIASGQTFQTSDIYQSMTLVGIVAILVPALIAFTIVYNSKELE